MKNKRAINIMVMFSVLKRVKKIPPSGGDSLAALLRTS
jgi:hypothetical protein